MSGIDRDIIPDPRPSLIDRHLPNTPQVQRLLRREGKAHVFNDRETLEQVTQVIIARGEQAHFRRARFSVIDFVTKLKSMDADKVFEPARIIQSYFRPVYAWNKPNMLGLRWVVKIPERFKNAGL